MTSEHIGQKVEVAIPEPIKTLPDVLDFSETQRREFEVRLQTYHEALFIKEGLRVQRAALDLEIKERETQARLELFIAEQARRNVQLSVAPSVQDRTLGRWQVVRERIAMKYGKLNRWYQQPVKLALRILVGKPMEIHPQVVPFLEAERAASDRLHEVLVESEKQKPDVVEVGRQQEIDRDILAAEKSIIRFLSEQAKNFREQILFLLSVFPQQEDLIIGTYIKNSAFSDSEREYFWSFLEDRPSLHQRAKSIFRKENWWLDRQIPTEAALRDLLGKDISVWTNVVRNRILEEKKA